MSPFANTLYADEEATTVKRAERRPLPVEYPTSAPPSKRLVSLERAVRLHDVLDRGRGGIGRGTGALLSSRLGRYPGDEILHARWEGFVAWDMIGPLFLFVVGTALPFSLARRLDDDPSPARLYGRIARRVALLWLLGMLAQGSLLKYQFHSLEFYSNTLQAIAVGYLVTSLALLHLRVRGQVVLFAALAVVYWLLLALVPFAACPAGTLERRSQSRLLCRSVGAGQLSPRPPLHVDPQQPGLFGDRPAGAGRPIAPHAPFRGAKTAAAGGGRLAVHGHRLAVELRAALESSYLDQLAGLLGRRHQPLIARPVLRAHRRGGHDGRWTFPLVVVGANALVAYVFSEVYGRTMSDVLVVNLATQCSAVYGELLCRWPRSACYGCCSGTCIGSGRFVRSEFGRWGSRL